MKPDDENEFIDHCQDEANSFLCDGALLDQAELDKATFVNDASVWNVTQPDDGFYGFENRVFSLWEHPANTQRLGQVYMNQLHKVRPDIAEKIQGTLFDPFYKEGIHPKVTDMVRSLWYEDDL